MKFSSSAARALHPTFFSCHPDDNGFRVDFIPPSLMDSSYSHVDGNDDLPPASIAAAAMDHIVNCNDSNDKEVVIVDSDLGLSCFSVVCCLMEASGRGPTRSGTNKSAKAAKAKTSDMTASIPISPPPTVAKGSSCQNNIITLHLMCHLCCMCLLPLLLTVFQSWMNSIVMLYIITM